MFEYDRLGSLALDVASSLGRPIVSSIGNLHETSAIGSSPTTPMTKVPTKTAIVSPPRRSSSGESAPDSFDCGASSGYESSSPLHSPAPHPGALFGIISASGINDDEDDATATANADRDLAALIDALNVDDDEEEEMPSMQLHHHRHHHHGLMSLPPPSSLPISLPMSMSTPRAVVDASALVMPPTATTPTNAVAVSPHADGFSAAEIEQFAQLLCSPKKTPPSRYQCHICFGRDHFISDCPMRFNNNYGRKKCFGEFTCSLCKRRWSSQNSVANEAQNCIKCGIAVFPHKQLPVDKAAALGLVKAQRTVPLHKTPVGHGRISA